MRYLLILLLLTGLPGCKSTGPAIPVAAQTNQARLDDTFKPLSRHTANYFFVEKIDGEAVLNGADRAYSASTGQGRLVLESMSRPLQADRTYLITLKGKTQHSSSLIALASGINTVTGEVEFTPQSNGFYRVTGGLSEDKGTIWIEDLQGNRVSALVERVAEQTQIDSQLPPSQTVQDKAELFKGVKPGESVQSVIHRLGPPDETQIIEGSFWAAKRALVKHSYTQYGSITYMTAGINGKEPISVVEVTVAMQAPEDIDALKASMATASAQQLRQTAQRYANNPGTTSSVLDIFAQKIWDERNTQDSTMLDAISWMCTAIGSSRNGRYRQALEEISGNTAANKLKKYADKALSKLGKGGTQFQLNK
ncbi:hypothetical protein [Shewanella sp. GXUN23E]|uniref:hypothetical protein n=1 Tax=Shewanella sp. GXUN23E TaxID=3422498 RepID=UPI003D7C97B6